MTYQAQLKEARSLLAEKKYREALNLYYKVEKETSSAIEKAKLWAEISWAHYYLNEFDNAIAASEKVLELNPGYKAKEDVFKIMGFCHLSLNQPAMAEKMLLQSLIENSNEPKQNYVKFELGKLLFKKGDFDKAFPLMKEIVSFFENENEEYALSVYFFLGFIYFYLNNYKDARNLFVKLFEKSDSGIRKAAASFGFAFIEFKQKNYLNVITLCEKILEYDENFFDKESVAFLTAASYFYLGRYDIFEKYYTKIQEMYPAGKYYDDLENLYKSMNHT